MMEKEFKTIIGLEIHLQLKTLSKMFCSCSTEFAAPANTNTCPVCLGWPGTLPSVNQKAVLFGLKGALALNCRINRESGFDRKNYFYPDLPKGFQITQYARPLGFEGFFTLGEKNIGIRRVHLEEDAGRTIYNQGNGEIDFNRAGIPLVEIVTEPDIESPGEARDFLKDLRLLILYLGISDCSMEEGSFRCDANISLKGEEEKISQNQVELKNLNSFQAIFRALEYEEKRQKKALLDGEEIKGETRGWDEKEGKTFLLREKGKKEDYRYFPEPDLPDLILRQDLIGSVAEDIPEPPMQREKRWQEEWGIGKEETGVLISDKAKADYFEKAANFASPKEVAKWIKEHLYAHVFPLEIPPEYLSEIIKMVEEGDLSFPQGKEVLKETLETGRKPGEIIDDKGWKQISNQEYIEELIEEIIENNPGVVQDYLAGKEKAIQNLMGKGMKKSEGQANPQTLRSLLEERLKGREEDG